MKTALLVVATVIAGPAAASELKICPPHSNISVWYDAGKNVSTYTCDGRYHHELPGKKCHVVATGRAFLTDRYVGRPQDPDDTGFCISLSDGDCHIECED